MIAQAKSDIVLVVDDSPDTVRLLTDVLDGVGMTVTVALDGAAALKIATRLRPDIVLMDAIMPGMDGFECCRRLKSLSGFDNVPIIFMTGLSEPKDSVRGFQAGGADYVNKPIDIDAMVARIGVHLANARKVQSARMALDVIDQFLVATDRDGNILWFTPQAYRLLEERFDGSSDDMRLPEDILVWLRARLAKAGQTLPAEDELVFSRAGLASRIIFVGEGERGQILFRVADAAPSDPMALARTRFLAHAAGMRSAVVDG